MLNYKTIPGGGNQTTTASDLNWEKAFNIPAEKLLYRTRRSAQGQWGLFVKLNAPFVLFILLNLVRLHNMYTKYK